jgi:hypothetical protein
MSDPTQHTQALGVFQSDIIIRSAIIEALADIEANPWLLRYAFASLANDPLTRTDYGEQEIERAKEWFLSTNVNVVMNLNTNEIKFPAVSITLMASNEVEGEGTLGDVHYKPQEDNDYEWPTVVGPISPTAYSVTSGIIAFDPATIPDSVVLAQGMIVVTKTGVQYPILEVVDNATVQIQPGIVTDLGGLTIKPSRPAFLTQLESTVYRETYAIGCHCDSEAVHLIYLHSVIVFALLRYKQALIEARGFERTTLTSADLRRDEQMLPEMLYNRYIQISGTVRQAWPKYITRKITGTLSAPVPTIGSGDPSPVMADDPFQDYADQDMLAIVAPKPKK